MKSLASSTRRPLAVASLIFPATLFATAGVAQTTQPEVVVTATRTPVTVDRALASVSVIDRRDIESSGALDLLSLLRREAGVDIVRGGGLGQQASVFLRGANSNQLLVLVDGVRVAAATTGGYAWEHLPLAQIERIEIVRGPRAALYGSDAIGGVIQVFTRRGDGASGSVGIGSDDTWLGEVGIGHRGERLRLGLRGSVADSGGFSSQNPDGFNFNPDDDGATLRSLAGDAGFDFSAAQLDAQWLASNDDIEFDQGETAVRQRSGRVALAGGDSAAWLLAAAHARETLETPAFAARFETRRNQFDWQLAHALAGDGELLWGLALVDERGASIDSSSGDVQYRGDRDHRAAFASWRDGHADWSWELAARHDDYDSFGGETSGQAALGWAISAQDRLRASVAEGFRAPNLNELYSPGFGGLFAGNPALGPERSRAWELGSTHERGAFSLDWRLYHNDVRGLVDFSGDDFQAINIGRARLRGAEAEWRWQHGDWQLGGNLGWQQASNRDTGAALLRRAPRKAGVSVAHPLGRGQVGIEWQAVSARPEFGGALPGYAIGSAWLRWPLGERLELDLRLENLTDRDYELLRGFNTAGFGGLLQLRWRTGS